LSAVTFQSYKVNIRRGVACLDADRLMDCLTSRSNRLVWRAMPLARYVERRRRDRRRCRRIRHQISDGENGFLVSTVDQAAERIVQLLRDPQLRRGLGDRAKETVREKSSG
jgi:hypothetical protein